MVVGVNYPIGVVMDLVFQLGIHSHILQVTLKHLVTSKAITIPLIHLVIHITRVGIFAGPPQAKEWFQNEERDPRGEEGPVGQKEREFRYWHI